MRERLPDVLGLGGDGIRSVCVCGSYARGDFMGGSSDLDFNVFLEDDTDSTTGQQAIRDLAASLLKGRTLQSHNPNQFDWLVLPWASLPKRGEEVHVPKDRPHFPLLNVFLFDYIEHLLVLWGRDPREVLPAAPNFRRLAGEWFDSVPTTRERYVREGNEWRIPFNAFKSLLVAQALFGERTLDKRRLMELYTANVPEFSMKDFGCRMIRDRLAARYPETPCQFAPYGEYVAFEDALSDVVKAELAQTPSQGPSARNDG